MKFDNANIYASLEDPKIEKDLAAALQQGKSAAELAASLEFKDANNLASCLKSFDDAEIVVNDIYTFATLIQVVDSSNEAAEQLTARADVLLSELAQLAVPLNNRLMELSDADFQRLLDEPVLTPYHFTLRHRREMAVHRLSVAEETLLKQMAVDGLQAWDDQYFKLSATIQVEINGETMGLASAFNLTQSADRDIREAAWKAIRQGWSTHQESVVAGLNAINGWRLSEFSRRSHKKDLHYLDIACHQSHIQRSTLDALLDTGYENRAVGHRAIQAMNRWNGIEDGKPWDLMAAPKETDDVEKASIPFAEAMGIICKAFGEFDPEMAEFTRMMADKGWVDADPTPNRATGAFCTSFDGAGEPRVFMTYEGTMGNVLTLAHELGHAWHAWLLRDLQPSEREYPMTLAETASIFAETLVRQALLNKAETDAEKRHILWQEAETASALLINIPARFEFEKNFVEARKSTKVSANAARKLMLGAWEKWYGNSISEYDEMFWASKLHFSIAEIGFYNYPYLFGYLFALGVYAQKDKQGDNFRFAYRELLRDTGRMSAEDCIQKHLDRDIGKAAFWQDSLDMVESSISAFEALV